MNHKRAWRVAVGVGLIVVFVGLTRLDERQKAAARAIKKAEVATEKRFEGVNEFRGVLTDQQGRFVTRTELIAAITVVIALIALANRFL